MPLMMRTKKAGPKPVDFDFCQIHNGLNLGQHLLVFGTFFWFDVSFETLGKVLASWPCALTLFTAEWLKLIISKYASGHASVLSLPFVANPVKGDPTKGTLLRRIILRLKQLLHQFKPYQIVWNGLVGLLKLWIFIIYATLCFGAPLLSQQAETLALAFLILVMTFLPVLVIQGPEIERLTMKLLDAEVSGTDHLTIVLRQRAIWTLVGAWLGAIPIPLDWDRSWQTWPITCYLGALIGNAFGSIRSLWQIKKNPISSRYV